MFFKSNRFSNGNEINRYECYYGFCSGGFITEYFFPSALCGSTTILWASVKEHKDNDSQFFRVLKSFSVHCHSAKIKTRHGFSLPKGIHSKFCHYLLIICCSKLVLFCGIQKDKLWRMFVHLDYVKDSYWPVLLVNRNQCNQCNLTDEETTL